MCSKHSLEIGAGEYVALVGPSGVGKTTLCSLIPRFYEVSAGGILLDGHDIRDIQPALAAPQHRRGAAGCLFICREQSRTISAMANSMPAMTKSLAAAKKANAHDFILALPDGYDTDIGQRGVKLSGGQKQRFSIARVFLKDPPIIIFDEATSALDNESERAVQASLEQLPNNRTTLVIAHRLSTIRNAQRIVVLTDKGIAERARTRN